MKIKPLEDIRAFLQPIAAGMEIEIVDVEFKQGRAPALTVYIDTEKGVDLDTCEKFHNAIDPALDEFDPTFGEGYTLNVSSPGLDRPLKTPRDFEKTMGKKVEIKLFAPIKGVKYFEGVLQSYDGNCIVVAAKEEELKLEISKIAKINQAVIFEN